MSEVVYRLHATFFECMRRAHLRALHGETSPHRDAAGPSKVLNSPICTSAAVCCPARDATSGHRHKRRVQPRKGRVQCHVVNSTSWPKTSLTCDQGEVSQDAGQSLRLQSSSLGGMGGRQRSSGRTRESGGSRRVSCTHTTRRVWCPPPQIAEHGPNPCVRHLSAHNSRACRHVGARQHGY